MGKVTVMGVAWIALLVAIVSAVFAGLRYRHAQTVRQQQLSEIQYQAYRTDGTVTLHQTGGTTYPLSQIRVLARFQKDPLDLPSKGQGFPLKVASLIKSNKSLDRTYTIRNIDSIICRKEQFDCTEYDIVAIDFFFDVHGEKRKVPVYY